MIDRIVANGSSLNVANKTSSVASPDKLIPDFCTLIAVEPNAENQKKLTKDGSNNTPVKNSRIVRPLETRAMKIPTNGI